MSKLNEKAILVHLICHSMNFSKKDKEVTEETTINKKASANAARVYKSLISKTALKPIQKAINAAKTYHDKVTLPYYDRGARLLPSSMYFEYCQKIRGLQNDIKVAVDTFVNKYDEHVHNAQKELGDMFDWNDYPDISQVKNKFGIDLQMFPVPDSSVISQLAFCNIPGIHDDASDGRIVKVVLRDKGEISPRPVLVAAPDLSAAGAPGASNQLR